MHILGAVALAALIAQQPDPVWMGIGFTLGDGGARVNALPFGSPAAKAGVLINDFIVMIDGQPVAGELQIRETIASRKPGDPVTLRVARSGAELDITVIIEERPAGIGEVKEYTPLTIPKVARPEERLANELIDEFNIRSAYDDLRQRLGRLSDRGDAFRLSRLAYIQDEPFQLRTVAGSTLDQLAGMNPSTAVRLASEWLDAPAAPSAFVLKRGLSLDQHLDQLVSLLEQVRAKRAEAFWQLNPDTRKYLEEKSGVLLASFSESVAMEFNAETAAVLQLSQAVDYAKLFEAASLMTLITQDAYLDDLESAVRVAWEAAGRPENAIINRDSPVGKIVVGGSGGNWYTGDAAILLDLAGRDFYTNNAGAARGDGLPAALLIDFSGDDAYEATLAYTQGAALMGHGLLIDRQGHDQYVSRALAQGAAVLGSALFLDESGNDVYRADEYAQGMALWGIAVHADLQGDDMYEAHLLSQGVGMSGGAGLLLNGRGDDRYYSKGKRPTGYGDAGIFDSWSQGLAVGFRGLQSGGAAVLYDGAGRDRYEAGNFSQGGGYYFGVGLMRDAGRENDTYIGSRYNQGFAAHQAVGFFEEMGGNDFYTTRHAVAQGTSWDETVVVFVDHAGDDVYEGGASFSHGAAAHNGFCLFLDLGGRNRFQYSGKPGNAGPNDYHGGSSFSLFVAPRAGSGSVEVNGDHGIFADLRRLRR
jgi:hypothetical protein